MWHSCQTNCMLVLLCWSIHPWEACRAQGCDMITVASSVWKSALPSCWSCNRDIDQRDLSLCKHQETMTMLLGSLLANHKHFIVQNHTHARTRSTCRRSGMMDNLKAAYDFSWQQHFLCNSKQATCLMKPPPHLLWGLLLFEQCWRFGHPCRGVHRHPWHCPCQREHPGPALAQCHQSPSVVGVLHHVGNHCYAGWQPLGWRVHPLVARRMAFPGAHDRPYHPCSFCQGVHHCGPCLGGGHHVLDRIHWPFAAADCQEASATARVC